MEQPGNVLPIKRANQLSLKRPGWREKTRETGGGAKMAEKRGKCGGARKKGEEKKKTKGQKSSGPETRTTS